MRSTACRLACRTVEGGLVHANRRRDRGLVRRRANRACDTSTEEAAGPLQSRGSWLDDRQCVASGRQPPKQADEYQPIDVGRLHIDLVGVHRAFSVQGSPCGGELGATPADPAADGGKETTLRQHRKTASPMLPPLASPMRFARGTRIAAYWS